MKPQAMIKIASSASGAGVSRRRRGRRGSSGDSSGHSSSATGSYGPSVGSRTWLSAVGASSTGVCSWAMTGSSLGGDGLLKAQRFDRSQAGGTSGWVGAEEKAGQRRRAEGEEDRVGGDLRVHASDLELAADHADEHAGEAADQGHEHGLGQ